MESTGSNDAATESILTRGRGSPETNAGDAMSRGLSRICVNALEAAVDNDRCIWRVLLSFVLHCAGETTTQETSRAGR